MKRKKLMASLTAVIMSVTTLLASVGTVYAEEGTVTDKIPVALEFENGGIEKTIAKEDAEVINEVFGYVIGDNNVVVCGEGTKAYVNWDASSTEAFTDVFHTEILCPQFSRDENGKLVVALDDDGYVAYDYCGSMAWGGYEDSSYAGGELNFFDIRDSVYYESNSINNNMGRTTFLDYVGNEIVESYEISDVYLVRFSYATDGYGNWYESPVDHDIRTWSYVDWWILPEGVETVLEFQDEETGGTTDDNTTAPYILELAEGGEVVSTETFATLLEENETRDVIIKNADGVTFTFAKGTMQTVKGKESYDFTTTVNSVYDAKLPSYVTKDNFVSLINYSYSGKLPAEATIRFCVGTQFAGKTLYYYLLNEDESFAEVQTVTVDSQGYISVKQDHCSSYVVSSEKPQLQNNGNTNNTTTPNTDNVDSPKTEDNSFWMPSILMCVGMLGVVVVARKRTRV